MNTETRKCQNCHNDFVIEPDDFLFYEKMKVPPPTFCPECRMIRRMMIRNERTLHKRECGLCGKEVVSMYHKESPFTVYCITCWHSDNWDPLSYGKEYDFSKPFFGQFQELMRVVPRAALFQDFVEKSDYTNYAVYLKNCYLVFGGHHYEDCFYSSQSFYLNNCFDDDFCKKCEQCYDSLHLKQCTRVHFSLFSEDCTDSYFLFNCRNCTNCIGCTNLRNKSYCIFNEQYSKEDYTKKLKEMNLGSYQSIQTLLNKSLEQSLKFPRKYAWTRNAVNSSGDDLENVKNCRHCFSVSEGENCGYSFFLPTGAKDVYDADHTGVGEELAYEIMSSFNSHRVAFSNRIYGSNDVYYSDDCHGSNNIFGCIGLRNQSYVILNKKYQKEEYEKLILRIVDDMKKSSYVGKKERNYSYGEFFPVGLSPFTYNETVVQEYFSLTKEEALARDYEWRDSTTRNYTITKGPEDLSDNIINADDTLLKETIGCAHGGKCNEQCTTAFKVIKEELQFYKKMNLPLPRLCPNCRHYRRIKQRNSLKLWKRTCQCKGKISENSTYQNTAEHFHKKEMCPNEFETTYSPERKEIIYCEKCYQAEVA